MNVVALYNQVTTTWDRLRASILSHLFAAFLLWLVGFRLPLPDLGLSDINVLVQHPLYEHLKGIGLLALVSLCIAFAAGAYALLLRETGRIILFVLLLVFPPDLRIERIRRRTPRNGLFVIAATLDPGEYRANDLGSRLDELMGEFALAKPEEFKSLADKPSEIQKNATTHLQNASVFLFAWVLAGILLPADNPFGQSVDTVFWPGFGVLLAYLLVSFRRFVVGLELTLLQLTRITARLVTLDPEYSERLRTARRAPDPYFALVDAYRRSEPRDDQASSRPSLKSWFLWQIDSDKRSKGGHQDSAKPETFTGRVRHFGWDESVHGDFEDPLWLVCYALWRLRRVYYRCKGLALALLQVLGLHRLE